MFAVRVAHRLGFAPIVTSGARSLTKQQALRDAWARGESRFPANRPGDSSHNFGLAFDSVVDAQHQWLWDRVRRLIGFEVLPGDRIHAQAPNWRAYVAATGMQPIR